MSYIATNLKFFRRVRGLTQKELADKTSVSYHTLYKLEQGAIRNPRLRTLESLALALDVSVADLTATTATTFSSQTFPTPTLQEIEESFNMLKDLKKPFKVQGKEYDTLYLPKDMFEEIEKENPWIKGSSYVMKSPLTTEEGSKPLLLNRELLENATMMQFYATPVIKRSTDILNTFGLTS